ncbi:hypothetical protein CRUP_025381, partial [Coryphaenoides rupestris]
MYQVDGVLGTVLQGGQPGDLLQLLVTCLPLGNHTHQVSRELPMEEEIIQTQLHCRSSEEHYTYTNVPWKLYLRKEVWRNPNVFNAERGWLLLLGCLCAFAPSPKMEKHMLKFVSDHAPVETQALLQHRLIQANQKAQQSSGSTPETARTYPPTLLEWTANRKKASMVLQLHCFDGEGVTEWWKGYSVLMKEQGQWVELAGHDYVLDLISDLELPPDFPKQKSYFIISAEGPTRDPKFGMLTAPLEVPLTRTDEDLTEAALELFTLVLRFMGDAHLNGAQENMFGNYVIQRGLTAPGLRDEVLAQLANQVWRNPNVYNAERGWLLLLGCLCAFAPSPKMEKHMLKFVSDHAPVETQALLQHRLIQANQKAQQSSGSTPETARTYPPTLLEREVFNVTHLAIPSELATLLHTAAVGSELHSDCLALLQAPHIRDETQLTLPLDINNYPFYRYVQAYFKVPAALRLEADDLVAEQHVAVAHEEHACVALQCDRRQLQEGGLELVADGGGLVPPGHRAALPARASLLLGQHLR